MSPPGTKLPFSSRVISSAFDAGADINQSSEIASSHSSREESHELGSHWSRWRLTSFPFAINAHGNENFVLENPFTFSDRFDGQPRFLKSLNP